MNKNWFKNIFYNKKKLKKGLKYTRNFFFKKIYNVIIGKSIIDENILNKLEEILILSDLGGKITINIINNIKKRINKEKYIYVNDIYTILREEIISLFYKSKQVKNINYYIKNNKKPYVIMVVGVNGVGKTTTIGKLSYKFKKCGLNVIIGAADTFRLAAIDQLNIWAKRANVDIVKNVIGSDPASIAFDTLKLAKIKNKDIVLIDTAGILHNNINFMKKLQKIQYVMKKIIPEAPQEVMLVLDGSIGHNSFEQVKKFNDILNIDSLTITKLDGTAKGVGIIGISNELKIPIKYIGLGEKIEDIQYFDKFNFIDAFLNFPNWK